jgi:hypothetical protein
MRNAPSRQAPPGASSISDNGKSNSEILSESARRAQATSQQLQMPAIAPSTTAVGLALWMPAAAMSALSDIIDRQGRPMAFWVSAWTNTSKKTGDKFWSLSIRRKNDKQEGKQPDEVFDVSTR